jgi:hypothetical protein
LTSAARLGTEERARRFRWAHSAGWIAETAALVREIAGGAVFARSRRSAPGGRPPWAPGWLEERVGSVHAGSVLDGLVRRFRERFDSVEAFHAGRPVASDAYVTGGVRLASPQVLIEEAHEVFCRGPGAWAAPAALDDVLAGQDLSLVDGVAGFSLDHRYLLTCDTFYFHYGSHFLLGLAVELRNRHRCDALPRLRCRGRPAMAVCAIPLDTLEEETVPRLCMEAVRLALAGAAAAPAVERVRFDFTLRSSLAPAAVLRQWNPGRVRDTLYGDRTVVS